jgi:hypothetical protein
MKTRSSVMSVILVPGLQAHIFERAVLGLALVLVLDIIRVRHDAGHRDDVLGRGAPGDDRRQAGGVEHDSRSKCAPSSVQSVSQ